MRSVRKRTVGETTSAAMPSHVGVSTDSLDLQLGHVITRLQQSYPELAEGEIHDIVRAALHDLDGARLHQFVPLLVEKSGRTACRERRTGRRRSEVADGPVVHASDRRQPRRMSSRVR